MPTQPLVILDPGHGGTHAYGGSSPLGVTSVAGPAEKHVTLALAQRVAARLGPLAALTRQDDRNMALAERARLARRLGARALISLHANTGAVGARGTEVWLHERHDAGSAALAHELARSLGQVGPARGVFQGPLAVLDPYATGGVAACLIEADYLSDPAGRQRLSEARGLDELAEAIAGGVRRYLGNGESSAAIAHGLPNLTFGPRGPGGRPVGAATFSATPLVGTPVQISWFDYNESDTMAGSYWDEVWVSDAGGTQLFSERVRVPGLAAGANLGNYVLWTPRAPGPVTARVRLNTGAYAIPEDSLLDNESSVSATVGSVTYGQSTAIAVREVNGPEGLTARYRHDQPLSGTALHSISPAHDFTHRFIWLVWPQRARPADPPASIDIDLTMELFDGDPRTGTPTLLDSRVRRVRLTEDARFGYEYSRLPSPPSGSFWMRLQFTDYSPQQNAYELLWTQAYG